MNFPEKDLETIPCEICKSMDFRKLYDKEGLGVVKCSKCGLIYVNPRLTDAARKRMYESNALDPTDYLLRNREVDRKTFGERMDYIEMRMKELGVLDARNPRKHGSKILDVGCAIGVLLEVARERGWDAKGIELAKETSAYCRNKLELHVETGTIQQSKFRDKSFDVVACTGTIEHFSNPLDVLRHARKKLKDDGILLMTTPDIGSLHAKLFGKHWLQVKPLEHIFYFSPETAKKLLEKAGFEMVEWKHVSNFRNPATLAEKIGGKKLEDFVRKTLGKEFADNFGIRINPYDEMMVLARCK